MVKSLSEKDNDAIHQAVLAAEQVSSTEIAVVIMPASDEYRAAALLCGLGMGTIVSLLLWYQDLIDGPIVIICVQLAIMLLFLVTPFLRHLCLRVEPQHYLHRRAAQRAAEHYLHLARHLPSSKPIVMLYISLAERYVHIHISQSAREKIPDSEWNNVVKTLTTAVNSHGLAAAVIKAITHAGEMLALHFPSSKKA